MGNISSPNSTALVLRGSISVPANVTDTTTNQTGHLTLLPLYLAYEHDSHTLKSENPTHELKWCGTHREQPNNVTLDMLDMQARSMRHAAISREILQGSTLLLLGSTTTLAAAAQ